MSTFSLLWGSILRSSLWVQESKETRLVWITMLAIKDREGIIRSSVIGLADAAKVSVEECKIALQALSSPDPNDSSKVDEGRRIREINGGWQIVNHAKYQFSTEAKREAWRIRKARQREREVSGTKRSKPSPGEKQFLEMEQRGEDTSLEPGNKIPITQPNNEHRNKQHTKNTGKSTPQNQDAGMEGQEPDDAGRTGEWDP